MNGSAVPITHSAEPTYFNAVDDLPADASALFDAAGDNLFGSQAWYRAVLAAGMSDAADARFLLCRTADRRAAALFPMRSLDRGRDLESLTTLYTCRYQPLIADGLDARALTEAFLHVARYCRAWPTTRIDALPADWRHLGSFIHSARTAGLAVRQFDHFGNWHEPVRGVTWQDYLSGRPGQLRETIRRKLRRSERNAECHFEMITGGERLEPGIAAFESVYRRSWKEPEPFPDFNATLMRHIAVCGVLRLGVLHIGATAVAAQLWVVERDRATVLKLAHDEAFKPASPGTVLTALMLRGLLDDEHVAEIDFGRGDDPYKAGWAGLRRQRIGLVLANPRHPRGLAFLGRHAMGRARAMLRGVGS
jgi:hypothetical protein